MNIYGHIKQAILELDKFIFSNMDHLNLNHKLYIVQKIISLFKRLFTIIYVQLQKMNY